MMDFLEEIGESSSQPVIEEYVPPKKASIWNVMNSALDKKMNPSDSEKEKIPEFMFHELLLKFEETVPLALMFTTKNIPVKHQYNIVREFTPKVKIPWENRKKKNEDKVIERISRYYRCNEKTAKEYIEILPETEIQRITSIYDTGKIKGN